jgi:hypothetical protein
MTGRDAKARATAEWECRQDGITQEEAAGDKVILILIQVARRGPAVGVEDMELQEPMGNRVMTPFRQVLVELHMGQTTPWKPTWGLEVVAAGLIAIRAAHPMEEMVGTEVVWVSCLPARCSFLGACHRMVRMAGMADRVQVQAEVAQVDQYSSPLAPDRSAMGASQPEPA